MLGRIAKGSLGLSLGWSALLAPATLVASTFATPVLLPSLGLSALAPAAWAQGAPQGPPAVGVIELKPRPVTESTEFVGRVEATDRVDLKARVTGFMQERLFQEGQEVKRGDVLYRLERPPFEAQVAQAQASVASAEAELTNARVSLARAQDLARSNYGTRANLDTATAQERTANANLLSAQAQLRVAQINLGYTNIIAPIDGRIGRTNLTIGNVVSPDTGTLATIVSQDPMRVSFPISSRAATQLYQRYANRGGIDAVRVRIRLNTGDLYPESGRIEFIDNQINRNTDTILVRALIANPVRGHTPNGGTVPSRSLIDGQFVNVYVEGVEPVQAIVVPRAAVLQDQQGSYVFIVDGEKKAQRRDVTLGRALGADTVVEKGLNPGDTMITEGIQRVRPGQVVNPAPAAPAAAPAAGPVQPGSAPAGSAPAGSAPTSAPSGNAPAGTPPASAPNGGSQPGGSQAPSTQPASPAQRNPG
ncbi:efflux RND transporter periplasmic adaptor subunit [Roseomonas gilardii subsp. gilardii]|uniref:efflux RND transporter periplasmic adaptor subunit n=1 Tax=Roseomonas gilardii TaxID=257708 RepID=UPI001FF9843D|nr:efflux RND transporter periplasmic adaptor subunit [Roseomonas gilardii]UPG71926.1 efflux RND transporter periplasmic adaptor subunit [Roseomonas gilardii subsp. gilardii]